MRLPLLRGLQAGPFPFRRGAGALLIAGFLTVPLAVSAVAQQQGTSRPPDEPVTTSTDAQSQQPAETQQPADVQQAPPAAQPGDLPAGTTPAPPQDVPTAVLSNTNPKKKTRKGSEEPKQSKKDEKVVQSKDTVAEQRAQKRRLKDNPLANVNSTQPDKQLYDRALAAMKKGKYDVSRLLLQDMLATYPDSEYQMRAKLAFADSWYREGGTAALTQAETEYHDFIIFFPNAPEAAEAQMRIGDIYFKQMDKPDRDYAKAVHAEEEYRNMLTQYPDSSLIPAAKQKLREVQELLATREASIGDFYLGRENFAAAIARLQTVVDTYPLYSKIDSVLIGLGDAYATQARMVRVNPNLKNLSEDQRSRLLRLYEDQAAAAYGRVVTQYSASPRVEDARDRLEALQRPIPEPTADQVAASQALENSRQTYNLKNRAKLLVIRTPDVVQASRIGEPSLADPKATLAPNITKRMDGEIKAALNPSAAPQQSQATVPVSTDAAAAPAATDAEGNPVASPAATPTSGQPALSDIPASDSSTAATGTTFAEPAASAPASGAGDRSVGVTILTPGVTKETNAGNGLNSVGPANNTALPDVEKAATAPDAVNDVSGVRTPQGQAPPEPNAKGKVKNPKPDYDKDIESSSTHKKKKGLKKINPF